MKKPMSVRKKFRKKMLKNKKKIKNTLRSLEKTSFLQWSATTVNGVKQ